MIYVLDGIVDVSDTEIVRQVIGRLAEGVQHLSGSSVGIAMLHQ